MNGEIGVFSRHLPAATTNFTIVQLPLQKSSCLMECIII